MNQLYFAWGGFLLVIVILLALDLGVFNREAHVIHPKEALIWTSIWIAVALIFNFLVYLFYEYQWLGLGVDPDYHTSGQEAALAFFTAYLVEKSLSLDNIFVIAMIFSYFQIPSKYQHRVLFWGITGAIVMRGILIFIGVSLIQRFSWLVYIFGVLLIVTGVRMLIARHDNMDPKKNPIVRLIQRFFPITEELHEQKFFIRLEHKLYVTPLFLALVLIETTDLLFALDSIPAIFAISLDPFIILTSNVFAILGLRALYFALAGMMQWFRHVKTSLVFVLVFVGVKMLLVHHYPIPAIVSLVVISTILGVGISASIFGGRNDTAALESPIKPKMKQYTEKTLSEVKRVIIFVLGTTLMLLGLLLLILPGPGLLIILFGLVILSSEFYWAKKWMTSVQDKIETVKMKIKSKG